MSSTLTFLCPGPRSTGIIRGAWNTNYEVIPALTCLTIAATNAFHLLTTFCFPLANFAPRNMASWHLHKVLLCLAANSSQASIFFCHIFATSSSKAARRALCSAVMALRACAVSLTVCLARGNCLRVRGLAVKVVP